MKRLLRISFDTLLTSAFTILSWFVLSIILDKDLINVFSLTYPLQFIGWALWTIFGTGANISQEKDKNSNAVMSGIMIGSAIGLLIFGLVALNINGYINFMNMDVTTYNEFALYSIVQIYLGLIFNCLLSKLYFENKNKQANKYSIIYNLVNLVALILLVLIFKNRTMIVSIASVIGLITVLTIGFKNFDRFKLQCNVWSFIKYESFAVFRLLMLFATYLIGFKLAFNFGEQYITALTFIGIISDTQWDMVASAIPNAAKIDLAKGKFDYKTHLKNAYKLCGLMTVSMIIMALALWQYYEVPSVVTLVLILLEIYSLMIYPLSGVNNSFLQLNYSAKITTGNYAATSVIRLLTTFLLNTPYRVGLGSAIAYTYDAISTSIIFRKKCTVDKRL